jgi:hypothetical protein
MNEYQETINAIHAVTASIQVLKAHGLDASVELVKLRELIAKL